MFYNQSDADGGLLALSGWRTVFGDSNDCGEGAILAPSEIPQGEEADSDGLEPGLPHRAYERELVQSVWEFAEVVPGTDPALWRKDEFGGWIHRFDYGRRGSAFGWEIFDPGIGRHSQGVYAMRPMQWESYIRQYEAFA
ncbi:MAG TPA: hypothetical protein PLA50_10595 [Bacteroidia bacterium]|nr:hypothetical protein [Bacteroidia bacterium]